MRESEIEKYLVERVKALGGEVRKVRWVGRNGAPDRLVMLPDEYPAYVDHVYTCSLWVELKATGKKPEPHQRREHERMRRLGQHVVVIDSIEGVDGLLS